METNHHFYLLSCSDLDGSRSSKMAFSLVTRSAPAVRGTLFFLSMYKMSCALSEYLKDFGKTFSFLCHHLGNE